MVTPSRLFSSNPPSVVKTATETRLEHEKFYAARVSEKDVEVALVSIRITVLSDQTSLETERPEPSQDGYYMVAVTMTSGVQVQRRVIPVKAKAHDNEVSVGRRVHSAFVRSVCEAKHVVPLPPNNEDQGFSLRRTSFGATHVETGESLRAHGAPLRSDVPRSLGRSLFL